MKISDQQPIEDGCQEPEEITRKRRSRRINTCNDCQRLKRKCSRTFPCSNCQTTSRHCVFPSSPWRNTATSHDSTAPSSVRSELDIRTPYDIGILKETNDSIGQLGHPQEICLRIDKMTLGERIGGILRSHLVENLDAVLQQGNSGHQLVDHFSAPISAWIRSLRPLALGTLLSVNSSCTEQLIFSQAQETTLIGHFMIAVQPVCHVVTSADLRWYDPSTRLLRLAVCYASACSLPTLESPNLFGMTKETLVKTLKTYTELSLSKADIFGQPSLCTFQAVAVYLTPQLVSEVSQSHSMFIAAVVRSAQVAGLDRYSVDESLYGNEMKWHVWQQLLFLNARVAEAIGPERTVFDDSSCKPDKVGPTHTLYDIKACALMRYECYRIHRLVFKGRAKILSGSMSLSSFLHDLDSQTEKVRKTHLAHLNHQFSTQKYSSIVGDLLLARAEGMILQTQRRRWRDGISNQSLRRRWISANLIVAESGVALDTDPVLSHWSWYSGAYHQYHSVLALLVELHQTPNLPEAGRIMAVVDHCFGPSSLATVQARTRRVLAAIRDSMASFLKALGPSRQRNDDPLEETGWRSEANEDTVPFDDASFANFDLGDTMSEEEAWWQFSYEMNDTGNG